MGKLRQTALRQTLSAQFATGATTLHLNEIVLGSNFIRYDGPGDFQLLLRSDLFENHGFDEDMLLGWHVDSNIAARMLLKYQEVGDLGKQVYGYHCDHTRQVTPAHSHDEGAKRLEALCHRCCKRLDSRTSRRAWGCADDVIEEVRLAADPARVYVQALRDVIGDPLTAPNVVKYTGETYNKVDYDPKHLMPFLADMFVSMPRSLQCGLVRRERGNTPSVRGHLGKAEFHRQNSLGSSADHSKITATAIRYVSTPEVLAAADVFVVDFGGVAPRSIDRAPSILVSGELRRDFRRIVREERRRLSIGSNAAARYRA